MVSCVYVETEVRQHPRTLQLLEHLQKLHSVSLGSFRLTRNHFRSISRHYPEEPLFAQNMDLNNGIISYPLDREQEMIQFCETQLMQHIPAQSYHPCEWHD